MYVRFIVDRKDSNFWQANGIFCETQQLLDQGKLDTHEAEFAEATFAWFNQHLPCPPFRDKLASGAWTRDAVAWFLSDAKEPIAGMWDLVAILKQHSACVRILRSTAPRTIVYRDAYQVVAESPRNARQAKRCQLRVAA